MERSIKNLIVYSSFFLLLQAIPCHSMILQVGHGPDYPYSTISAAALAAQPGDTITIGDGNYTHYTGEDYPIIVTKELTLRRESSGIRPRLDSSGLSPVFICNPDFGTIRLEGLTCKNGKNNDENRGVVEIVQGIVVIDNCVITREVWKKGIGILVRKSDEITLSSCWLENQAVGVSSYSSHPYGTIRAINCIFSYIGRGFECFDLIDEPTDLFVTNCTLYGNNSSGSVGVLKAGNYGVIVKNSIIWNFNTSFYSVPFEFSAICSYVQGDGTVDDPKFKDPIGGDFHLRPDSPCIDSGCGGGAPFSDIDQEPRPNPDTGKVDIGADEYYEQPAFTVTPTPTQTAVPPTLSPTSTPTPSPSSTPTPTPLPRNSFLGGYWDTSLAGGQTGTLNIVALAPEATGMEVYAGGTPTGVMIPPFGPGGLFWLLYSSVSPPPEASGTRAYLEIVAMYPPPDPWQSWPALTVRP